MITTHPAFPLGAAAGISDLEYFAANCPAFPESASISLMASTVGIAAPGNFQSALQLAVWRANANARWRFMQAQEMLIERDRVLAASSAVYGNLY